MLQCIRHEQSLVVALLDLDGFKTINDLHGHGFGDKLLLALSCRMKEALRDSKVVNSMCQQSQLI
jgi:diguanylate cyclase (GGDEF)-like protein